MKKKAITAIIVLILLLAYPSWNIHKAKSRVNRFSQQISVGAPIKTGISLARELDLKIIRAEKDSSKPSKFIAWDGRAFTRWACFISYEKGKIQNIEVLSLD
jgi:hypothetical protein